MQNKPLTTEDPSVTESNRDMRTFTKAFFRKSGSRGGKAKGGRKAAAARRNGKLGGRPKSQPE